MPVGVEINPAELLGLALCVMILAYLVVNWRTVAGSRYIPVVYGFLCLSAAFLFTNAASFCSSLFDIGAPRKVAAAAYAPPSYLKETFTFAR